jgi:hypothetical protein
LLRQASLIATIIAGIGLPQADASAQEFSCYRNENGVMECSDAVTPEDSRFDRDILNDQGVRIRSEQGEITPEERAEMERLEREEAARLQAEQEARRYDRMLLDAYLDVEAIEDLRDRRLEIYEGQITITEIMLENLHKKLEGLRRDAQRFAPYSDREDAPPIPENLSLDIDRTESSIAVREAALDQIRHNQDEIRQEFQRDIDRFRELKGEQRDSLIAGSEGTLGNNADVR